MARAGPEQLKKFARSRPILFTISREPHRGARSRIPEHGFRFLVLVGHTHTHTQMRLSHSNGSRQMSRQIYVIGAHALTRARARRSSSGVTLHSASLAQLPLYPFCASAYRRTFLPHAPIFFPPQPPPSRPPFSPARPNSDTRRAQSQGGTCTVEASQDLVGRTVGCLSIFKLSSWPPQIDTWAAVAYICTCVVRLWLIPAVAFVGSLAR